MQDEPIYSQSLDTFPPITIPYPIFDKISEKLEIPSSKRIAFMLAKLIKMYKVKYMEDVLRMVKQVGEQDNFQRKMMVIYVIGLFSLPIFMLQGMPEYNHRQVNTKYTLRLSNKPGKAQLFLQAYSSHTKTNQQVLLDIWRIVTRQMSNHNIMVQNKTQASLELRYIHDITFKGSVRLPSMLRIQAREMKLVYPYSWKNVSGIQLPLYVSLLEFNNSDNFQVFLANFVSQMQIQLTANHRNNLYYLMLSSEDIFINEYECLIFTINRQSKSLSQWKGIKPCEKFNYYQYKLEKIYQYRQKCDFWSLAIIILEIISIMSNVKYFQKDLKKCNTVEKVKTCADEFIDKLEEKNIFFNKEILGKIRDYLNVEKIQKHYIVKQPQSKGKIMEGMSSQSDQDEQKPVMFVASSNNKVHSSFSSYH